MVQTVAVKRNGRTWDVLVNGKLIEGGFFSKDAAESAAQLYLTEN